MSYINSCLNYTGGKYKLLPQIMPLFPKNIDTFVDLFFGGASDGMMTIDQVFYMIFEDVSNNLHKSMEDIINSAIDLQTSQNKI